MTPGPANKNIQFYTLLQIATLLFFE